ncbi:MAG: hypothetical protein BMS9Abin25_0685 [Gammaproteobacteria bacterium]|nr:MAG: hypothetical protein BMS9Abin25_0685 [Gammaproteobacteria bacterium]
MQIERPLMQTRFTINQDSVNMLILKKLMHKHKLLRIK